MAAGTRLGRPSTYSALAAAFPDDPFVPSEIRSDATVLTVGTWWLARRTTPLRGDGWVVLRACANAGAEPVDDELLQLGALLRDTVQPGGPLTIERSSWARLQTQFPSAVHGGNWDWLCTSTSPPVHPLESQLVALDDEADAAELTELNRLHSPTAESEPGTGRTEWWLGARAEVDGRERLVAAGAVHRTPAGAPFLAGIVTDTAVRGQGFGAAIVSGLTRRVFQMPGPVPGTCSLGVYADNAGAIRLYHRLGYRTVHQFASRRFP